MLIFHKHTYKLYIQFFKYTTLSEFIHVISRADLQQMILILITDTIKVLQSRVY